MRTAVQSKIKYRQSKILRHLVAASPRNSYVSAWSLPIPATTNGRPRAASSTGSPSHKETRYETWTDQFRVGAGRPRDHVGHSQDEGTRLRFDRHLCQVS